VRLVQSEGSIPAAPLTHSEIEALLKVSGSEQPSLARRDQAVLMLLLRAGLRVHELVALQLDDVEFDHPGTHLLVRSGRGGEPRRIPLDGEERHALYEYLSVRPGVEGETHLFLSREGRPLSARSVQRIVSSRARAAGLGSVSPQVLRRTYASHLLDRTGDLALVSERLGHQSLTTTTRYMAESASSRV
jgi:site-specific recombinase XerC